MTGDTTELRVAFTSTRNSQLSPPECATGNATGAQLPTLKALAVNVLARNQSRNCRATDRENLAQLPTNSDDPELRIYQLLADACKGVDGMTPEVFRSLLSAEDLDDLLQGSDPPGCWRAYAQSFANGIRTGRIRLLRQDRSTSCDLKSQSHECQD